MSGAPHASFAVQPSVSTMEDQPLDFSLNKSKGEDIPQDRQSPMDDSTFLKSRHTSGSSGIGLPYSVSPPLSLSPRGRVSPNNPALIGSLFQQAMCPTVSHSNLVATYANALSIKAHSENSRNQEIEPLPSTSTEQRPIANWDPSSYLSVQLQNPFLIQTLSTFSDKIKNPNAVSVPPTSNMIAGAKFPHHPLLSLPHLSPDPPRYTNVPSLPVSYGQAQAEINAMSNTSYMEFKKAMMAKANQQKTRKINSDQPSSKRCKVVNEEPSSSSKKPSTTNNKEDPVYKMRRIKNNEAAKRSRDARRAKEDETAMRAAFLEQENFTLRAELAYLKKDTLQLRMIALGK